MANRTHYTDLSPDEQGLSLLDEFRKQARQDQESIWTFIQDHYHVKDIEGKGVIPFTFNDTQLRHHAYLDECRRKGKAIQELALKSRQVTFSTDVQGIISAETYLGDAQHAFVMAQEEERAAKLLEMHKLFYDELPADLKLPLAVCNKEEIGWKHSRSRITIANPKTKASGRGDTIHRATYSEAPFYDDLQGVMDARQAAIVKGPKRVIIIEGTANGTGNYFYDLCMAAMAGEIPYDFNFYEWQLDRRLVLPFPDDKTKAIFMNDILKHDEYLWSKAQKYKLTAEQLHFYWNQLYNEFRGNRLICSQEYPCDPLEAFISSGTPVFPMEVCQRYQHMTREGEKLNPEICLTGTVKKIVEFLPGNHLERNKNSYLEVWKDPVPHHRYLISGDVAEGIEGRDYSCCQVWDIDTFSLVAEAHGWLRATPLAIIMITLGRIYNQAVLVPENKHYGEAVIDAIKERGYWNVWRARKPKGAGYDVTNRLGFTNDGTTRPIMINKALEVFMLRQDDAEFIPSRMLIDELMKFTIEGAQGKPQAHRGSNDDRVMCFTIAVQCIVQYLNLGSASSMHAVAERNYQAPEHQHPRTVKKNLMTACGLKNAVEADWSEKYG